MRNSTRTKKQECNYSIIAASAISILFNENQVQIQTCREK